MVETLSRMVGGSAEPDPGFVGWSRNVHNIGFLDFTIVKSAFEVNSICLSYESASEEFQKPEPGPFLQHWIQVCPY